MRKLLIFIIFAFSINPLFSQQLITLELRNKPLKVVLQNLSKQSGYFFAYSSDKIDDNQKLTIVAVQQPLDIVLQQLCDQLNLTYTIVQKQIILKPLEKQTPHTNRRSIHLYTINGYVTDSSSGDYLIGANIYIDGQLKAFSNELGYFTVKTTKGIHQLKIQYTGYKSFLKTLKVHSDTFIKAKLSIEPQTLDIIVVTAKNNNSLNNILDFNDFQRQIILRNPGLGGTFDALKNLQAIPGFNFYGDGSLIFNVRGGLRSQNLITIDDAPLFNPVHLLGFFSSISPYAINTIRVYKNYIPVKYPGAGSAVIDIQLRSGNYYKNQVQAVINPILNSYLINGPVQKGRSSFMLTLRHSNYLNFNLNNKKSLLNINFIDLQSKLNFKLSKTNKISITGFIGGDRLKMTQSFLASKIWWYNTAGTIRWFHTFSPNLLLKTTAYTGSYTYFLQFNPDTVNVFNSLIFKSGVKSDLTYHFQENSIITGINVNYYYFNPANINNYAYLPSQNALENSLYLGGQLFLSERLKLNAGISYRFFANIGPTYLYKFDQLHNFIGIDTIGFKIYNTFSALEPRISLSYKLTPRWIIKGSWGKYQQFLQLLSNSISPFTTVEAWLPSNPNIPPVKTWQAAIGLAKINSEINFSIQGYYKKIFNFVEFSNFSSLLFNPYIEGQLRFGHAVSYGLEISLKRDKGRLNFWLAYNYSRTFFQSPDVWKNVWYPAHYDKPHIFYLNLTYNQKRLQSGLTFIYTSGNRFTAPVGFYEVLDHVAPVYSIPNNAQMPSYQRLDLFLKYRLNRRKRNFEHYLIFSIFNVLNRKNAVLVSFNKVYDQQNNYFYVPGNYIYQYQISPSFYYLFKAIPMVSYMFKLK